VPPRRRSSDECVPAEGPLCRQEAGAGLRRRSDPTRQLGFDPQTSEPVVNFRFNTAGSRKFAQATTENVGQPFAIVLDNEVIFRAGDQDADYRRPRGRSPAVFTAQVPPMISRSCCGPARLPAPLTVIEERNRSVPASARTRSKKGELAAYVGSIMVIVFMLVTYRLFGVFANIAVAINVAMIFRPAVAVERHADAGPASPASC